MGFHLPNRVQRHANDNEQGGSSKEEWYIELLNQHRRQDTDSGYVDSTAQRDSCENPIDELGRLGPWTNAGNVAADLLHIVRHLDRVEGHRCVEVAEKNDQSDVNDIVDPASGLQRISDLTGNRVLHKARDGPRENQQ